MPYAKRKIPLADNRVEVLDGNLAIALSTGRGFWDNAGLVTESDWRRAWNRWSSEILPAWAGRPGMRPVGMRCAGLLPPRTLVRPLPASHGFMITTVDGVQHVAAGICRYLACEADELLHQGVIDAREHRQHFATGTHDDHCGGVRI